MYFQESLKSQIPSLTEYFENVLLKDKLSNGYIFAGGNEKLKDLLVSQLGKTINCSENIKQRKDEGRNLKFSFLPPCEKCHSCLWLNSGKHPEVPIVIEPDFEKSKKGVVLLPQIQELLQRLNILSDYYRIIIIKKAEREFFPQEPANALLKSIEENISHSLFVFYADDPEQVLPTIRSRCSVLRFPTFYSYEDNKKFNQTASRIFRELFLSRKKLFYHEISALIASVTNEFKNTNKNEEGSNWQILVQELRGICLGEYLTTSDPKWQRAEEILGLAYKRLNAFCNASSVLEEAFLELQT